MSTTQSSTAPPTFVGQTLLATGFGYLAYQCYLNTAQGGHWLAAGVCVFSFLTVLSTIKALGAWDRSVDRLRRHAQLEDFADGHGKARLGNSEDAKQAGLFSSTGFVLGELAGNVVRYAGEGAMMVAGPPGSLKGVAFVLLNLLCLPKPTLQKWQSYFVLDVSAELYCVAARFLRSLGYNVVAICPEATRLSQELGVKIESVTLNPLDYLQAEDPNLNEEISMAAKCIHPGVEPAKQNSTSEHFDDKARQIIAFFLYWLLQRYRHATLPGLRRLTMCSSDELVCILEGAIESDAFGGAMAEAAASIQNLMAHSPEEYAGAFSTAQRSLQLYTAGSPVGQTVSESSFTWDQMKQQPTVVFVIIPPERLESQAAFLGLMILSASETLARHRSKRRVTFLLDEIGNVYVPTLKKIVNVYRKLGQQCIFVLQQLRSQMARVYGAEFAQELEGTCDVILALQTSAWEDLERLSKLIGMRTLPDGSHTLREHGDASHPERSYSGSYRGEWVLRPEEIRLISPQQGLVIKRSQPAFLVNLINYLHDPVIGRRADPNPYYRKD